MSVLIQKYGKSGRRKMNKYQEALNHIRLVCLVNSDDEEWLTRMSEGESVYTNEHKVLAWMPLPKEYEKE